MSSTAIRAVTGVLAAVPALLIWVIAVPVLDAELTTTDMRGQPIEIGPPAIIIFSVLPALAGWALLAILERVTPKRAQPIWTVVAVAVLLLSLVPLSQMSAGAAVTLGLIHLAVGVVIIAAMRKTSRSNKAKDLGRDGVDIARPDDRVVAG